jgi:predicted RNase H-like nuclease (RuvC/YqgF family)
MMQYTAKKKKRIRDPNLPPPPTLLGQVKELRLTRESITSLEARISRLEQDLRRKDQLIQNLESRINRITRHVKNG